MPPATVHIDRVNLDLHGVPASTAQNALSSLGPALARALAERSVSGSATRSAQIDHVDAGRIGLGASAGPGGLRDALAQRIATSVIRQLGPTPTL
jgi:hypothetical protein